MKLCPHSIIKTIFPKLLLSLNKDIVSSNFSKSKMEFFVSTAVINILSK